MEQNDYIVHKTKCNFIYETIVFVIQNLTTFLFYPIVVILTAKFGFMMAVAIVVSSVLSKLYLLYKYVLKVRTKYTITHDNLVVNRPYYTKVYELDTINLVYSKFTRNYLVYDNEKISLGFINQHHKFKEIIDNLKNK